MRVRLRNYVARCGALSVSCSTLGHSQLSSSSTGPLSFGNFVDLINFYLPSRPRLHVPISELEIASDTVIDSKFEPSEEDRKTLRWSSHEKPAARQSTRKSHQNVLLIFLSRNGINQIIAWPLVESRLTHNKSL